MHLVDGEDQTMPSAGGDPRTVEFNFLDNKVSYAPYSLTFIFLFRISVAVCVGRLFHTICYSVTIYPTLILR